MDMFIRRILIIWALALFSFTSIASSTPASADRVGVEVLDKFNIKPELKAQDYHLFGDKIDPVMGNLSFTQTDLNLPGNFTLPVKIERTLSGPDGWFADSREFASWSLVLPHVRSTLLSDPQGNFPTDHGAWALGTACSRPLGPGQYKLVSGTTFRVDERDYWAGDSIEIPGVGNEKILADTNGIKTTASGWKISCLNTSDGYEGFKVVDNNANTYYFTKIKYVQSLKSVDVSASTPTPPPCSFGHCPQPELPDPSEPQTFFINLRKYSVFLMPSKIVDKHGNYVNYTYSGDKLIKIQSSDGRSISISYNSNNYISSVTDGVHTYNYAYDTYDIATLSQVTRPDGRSWKFEHPKKSNEPGHYFWNRVTMGEHSQTLMGTGCPLGTVQGGVFARMTSPEGEQGTFSLHETYHGRTGIDKVPRPNPNRWPQYLVGYYDADCVSMISIYDKTVQDVDGSTKSWSYNYSQNEGAYNGETKIAPKTLDFDISFSGHDAGYFKSTTITNPDGSKEVFFFSRKLGWDENKLYAKEYINNSGHVVKIEEYQYYKGRYVGRSNVYLDEMSEQKIKEKLTSEILTADDGSTDKYSKQVTSFTDSDEPEIVHYFNDFSSNDLWKKITYFNLNSINLLDVVSGEEVSSDGRLWKSSDRKEFYTSGSGIGEISNSYVAGKLISTNYYNTDGTLQKTTYNGSGRYEQYDSYFRGTPRKITLPCNITNGCNTVNGSSANTVVALLSVNNDGTIQSVTDFNGNKVNYSYNPIGWLTKIDYADTKWLDKTIDYTTVTVANDGLSGSDIPAGSLRQTITQGNYQKRIYHDGLLRPIFVSERDTTNGTTARYQSFEYDAESRVILETFFNNSPANKLGNKTEYDVLGRVIRKTRTSDDREIQTSYLSNNSVAVTDGEGNTTTTYLAYGSPDYQLPISIDAPDTDSLSIAYNEFGQVTALSQGSVTENRVYDAYQELCKVVRPETGITAFGFNGQRQIIWRAEGTSGSATACDPGAVPSSQKVLIGYDNQGLIRTETYPDGLSNKTYSYDPQGNLVTLSAGNVLWNYQYNSLNLVAKETLTLDNRSFALTRNYNSLGALSSLTYPSGGTVDFLPNALGQATKAGTYASGVSYFANGQVKQFTYGNGILRTVQQDTSGRLDSLADAKSGVVKNNLKPAYDFNDNLTALIDFVDRSYDISNIHYDGVDRLISANGKWGTGSFSYDGMGNLLRRSYNNSTIGFQYNSRNLLNNLTGAYAYKYQYDARGNVINNGRYALSYNLAQQMTSAKSISYVYDGFNRKVKKTNSSGNSYTVYSKDGQLLYRLAPNGTQTDSIYLGKQIVAEVDR